MNDTAESPPTVSVVMAVYNGMPWLPSAVGGVLAQTYGNFEVVIVDDGSTDDTPCYLSRAGEGDRRIRVRRNPENRGLTASLNVGLSLARGEWIARQDADDLSRPERLARQLAFLAGNPGVGLLGSASDIVREGEGDRADTYFPPRTHTSLRWHLLFDNPFVHTSVMFRRILGGEPVRYHEHVRCAQDYDLWARMADRCLLANVSDALVQRREHGRSISLTRGREQRAVAESVSDTAMQALAPGMLVSRADVLRRWFRAFPEVLGDDDIVTAMESLRLLRAFGRLPNIDRAEFRTIRLRWCRCVVSALPDHRWKKALRRGLIPALLAVAPKLIAQDLAGRLGRRTGSASAR